MAIPKKVSESALVSARWMFPTDANPAGNVFGGSIVRYIDEIAGMVAQRHSRTNVVSASIDRMDFHEPVRVGDLLVLRATINCVGRTSMEVGVRVEAENLRTGRVRHAASAYLTMVALDESGRPTEVPTLMPESEDEKRRYAEGQVRRLKRLKKK